MKKALSIVMVTLILVAMASNLALAYNPASVKPNHSNVSEVTKLGNKIVGVIQVIGSILSVGILVLLGIKYMMGSTEEKAEYKKTMIPYLIGAVLIFASSNIAGMVFKTVSGL